MPFIGVYYAFICDIRATAEASMLLGEGAEQWVPNIFAFCPTNVLRNKFVLIKINFNFQKGLVGQNPDHMNISFTLLSASFGSDQNHGGSKFISGI